MYNAVRMVMVAAALTLSGAAAAQAPDPIIKTEGLRQISPHVHVIPDNSVPMVPNVGYIVGTTGILVIDTGMGARNGAAVAEVAKKLGGSRTMYLVTTHFHPEHDLGAEAFPADTKMLRSRDQEQDIAEFGLQLAQVFASRSAINAELLKGANFRKADITFDKEHVLDLGGVTARILAMGANHTRGDTAVWIEADRVLFSGDIAMRAQPAFASPLSRIDHWLASLARLDALKPTIVVPSHGPLGDPGFMAGYRTYLTAIREKVTAAKRGGQSADQTVEAVTNDMSGQYPDRARLGGAVRSAYGSVP